MNLADLFTAPQAGPTVDLATALFGNNPMGGPQGYWNVLPPGAMRQPIDSSFGPGMGWPGFAGPPPPPQEGPPPPQMKYGPNFHVPLGKELKPRGLVT